jgi:hypothetical protein
MLDRSITAILRWPALRRGLAAVCAAAFLLVGFAHTLHHFDTNIPAAYQVGAGPSDESPDSSKAPQAIEHCHGCVMVAMAIAEQSVAPVLVPLGSVAPRSESGRPHPPTVETPPPISMI